MLRKLLLGITVLTSTLLMAQDAEKENKIRFGITAGYTNLGLTSDFDTHPLLGDIDYDNNEAGFMVGAFVDIPVSKKFHLQPEVVFTAVKGIQTRADIFAMVPGESIDVRNLEKILFPILAKYYVLDNLSLVLGPQINASLEESQTDFRGITFAATGGFGLEIDQNASFIVRYSRQLTNSYSGADNITIHTNYLNVGFNYAF
ncbi:PorT family protein [Flavobacteriaceae bacterium]|nr:PorT family protein [Flavobacteriaceae bacterium]